MALTARTLGITVTKFTDMPPEEQELELATTIMNNKLEAVRNYVPKKGK